MISSGKCVLDKVKAAAAASSGVAVREAAADAEDVGTASAVGSSAAAGDASSAGGVTSIVRLLKPRAANICLPWTWPQAECDGLLALRTQGFLPLCAAGAAAAAADCYSRSYRTQ